MDKKEIVRRLVEINSMGLPFSKIEVEAGISKNNLSRWMKDDSEGVTFKRLTKWIKNRDTPTTCIPTVEYEEISRKMKFYEDLFSKTKNKKDVEETNKSNKIAVENPATTSEIEKEDVMPSGLNWKQQLEWKRNNKK